MLTDDQRSVYSRLADVLIPSAEGMPSASEADVPTKWINDALGYRPDLVPAFMRALELGTDDDAEAAVLHINASDSVAFDALGVLTSGSYFLNPTVKELIGYPGQVPSPAYDDTETYIDMLAAVVERGPIFRPTVR
ncbi:MAG: hypothetical protein F2881_07605 [Actinobacteria bacterium]|uniref:Unannotated protein n=1 Tax=freshwater metagenome TaxID=449393 RepID=A0A6J7QJ07_9ZZZZ|nr:hypothetical protein [Actinomycetota bacterium]